MREPLEECIPSVVMHDRLGDDRAQRRHAGRQPGWNPAGVKGKIGAAGPSSHDRPEIAQFGDDCTRGMLHCTERGSEPRCNALNRKRECKCGDFNESAGPFGRHRQDVRVDTVVVRRPLSGRWRDSDRPVDLSPLGLAVQPRLRNPPPAHERVHRAHGWPCSAGPLSCRRGVGAAARAAGRRLPHAVDAPVRRRLHRADRLDLDPDRGYERGTVSPELSRRHREFRRAQARHPGPRLQARHRYHHRHHHSVDRADDVRTRSGNTASACSPPPVPPVSSLVLPPGRC